MSTLPNIMPFNGAGGKSYLTAFIREMFNEEEIKEILLFLTTQDTSPEIITTSKRISIKRIY